MSRSLVSRLLHGRACTNVPGRTSPPAKRCNLDEGGLDVEGIGEQSAIVRLDLAQVVIDAPFIIADGSGRSVVLLSIRVFVDGAEARKALRPSWRSRHDRLVRHRHQAHRDRPCLAVLVCIARYLTVVRDVERVECHRIGP